MKHKEYVFSKLDRDWPVSSILLAVFRSVLLVSSFNAAKECGYDLTVIRIIWGTAVFALVLGPLFFGLNDYRPRFARYEFFDDFVRLKIGRKIRSIKAYDPLHFAVKTFIFKNMNTLIEKQYYILWKDGAKIPEDFSRPFRTLNQYEIIALPYNKEVRKKLCTLFGARKELTESNAQGKDMKYVLPDSGKAMFYYFHGIISIVVFACIAFIFVFFKSDRPILAMVMGSIILTLPCFLFLVLYCKAKKNEKYVFARYWFSDNAVYMLVGNEERMFCSSDDFQISLRAMPPTRNRKAGEEKYIVLWKSGDPEPEDPISEHRLMERFHCVVLPDTEEVRIQLRRTLGVKVIGYWVTAP